MASETEQGGKLHHEFTVASPDFFVNALTRLPEDLYPLNWGVGLQILDSGERYGFFDTAIDDHLRDAEARGVIPFSEVALKWTREAQGFVFVEPERPMYTYSPTKSGEGHIKRSFHRGGRVNSFHYSYGDLFGLGVTTQAYTDFVGNEISEVMKEGVYHVHGAHLEVSHWNPRRVKLEPKDEFVGEAAVSLEHEEDGESKVRIEHKDGDTNVYDSLVKFFDGLKSGEAA